MPENLKTFLAVYLAAINITACAAAWADKSRAARKAWRIPERSLLLLGLFGGAAGELLTMLLIRHKTRHPKFMLLLPLFILLHLAAISAAIFLKGM